MKPAGAPSCAVRGRLKAANALSCFGREGMKATKAHSDSMSLMKAANIVISLLESHERHIFAYAHSNPMGH